MATPHQLAQQFAAELHAEVGAETLATIQALNRDEANHDVCHSHDFCDANMTMARACEDLGITVFNGVGEIDDSTAGFWNEAWAIARRTRMV